MSKKAWELATKNAYSLRKFESKEEAEAFLFTERDELKAKIESFSENYRLHLDYTPESLKRLEKWYFDVCEVRGFPDIGISQELFEFCMGVYLGFVFTMNDSEFIWMAYESPFVPERYQLAITKRLYTRTIGPMSHLHKLSENKRRQSIFRDYTQSS